MRLRKSRFLWFVFFINSLVGITLLFAYCAPFVHPEDFWPISFFGLAFPAIFLCNLAFVPFWLLLWDLRFLFSLLLSLFGLSYGLKFVQFGKEASQNHNQNTSTKTLKVVTFNCHFLGAYGESNPPADAFIKWLEQERPDVICLQEFAHLNRNYHKTAFKAFFEKIKGYYQFNADSVAASYPNPLGVCIFSRYPIVEKGFVETINHTSNLTVFVDINLKGKRIRIINTHLKSIVFEEQDYITFKRVAETEINRRELYGIRRMIAKLKYAFRYRARQAEAIRQKQDYCIYPMIVCGDFNDPPTSYSYSTIRGDFKDAFVEAGTGFSTTYIGKMPSFRIDYILHNKEINTLDYQTFAFPFSDHKLVRATLEIE